MKVKDLIEKLQEFPENMEVVVDGGIFEYDADLDPREIVVKSRTSFTQHISQRRYKEMSDDAELDGSFVDEKVIYLG